MSARNFSTFAFVGLCLFLSGLVLRRQMVAHPIAPPPPQIQGNADYPYPPDFLGQPVDKRTWHVAMPPDREAVISSIQAELAACRAGDAQTALFYQTRHRRREFVTPEAFLSAMRRQYPEFADSRSAQFGPVWMDGTGQHADVTVTVRGMDGRQAQGTYEMVRTRDLYRVATIISSQN